LEEETRSAALLRAEAILKRKIAEEAKASADARKGWRIRVCTARAEKVGTWGSPATRLGTGGVDLMSSRPAAARIRWKQLAAGGAELQTAAAAAAAAAARGLKAECRGHGGRLAQRRHCD